LNADDSVDFELRFAGLVGAAAGKKLLRARPSSIGRSGKGPAKVAATIRICAVPVALACFFLGSLRGPPQRVPTADLGGASARCGLFERIHAIECLFNS
jgi:hypothetical protein